MSVATMAFRVLLLFAPILLGFALVVAGMLLRHAGVEAHHGEAGIVMIRHHRSAPLMPARIGRAIALR